jgi:hypothetical protein
MFRVGDYIVCLLDKMNGEYIIYEVVTKHKVKKGIPQLYDIRSTKTNFKFNKIRLPEEFYVKLEPAK